MRSVVLVAGVALASSARAEVRISDDEAAVLLYGSVKDAPESCAKKPACLITERYAKDPKARKLALALFEATGDIAGVGPDEIMDGGYRGKIHLVPELPIGTYRTQLEYLSTAMLAIDKFFVDLYAGSKLTPSYRWRTLGFRFVRSVDKRTPSAYATSWSITYNVSGSLLTSEAGVRETMFHEVFHLNDQEHKDWSAKTLQSDYDAIVKKCGQDTKNAEATNKCLAPFAPNATTVRGGIYYAFQPNNGNGVHEYAAELAVRYWKEHVELLAKKRLGKPAFKCGGPENARSWKALVDEFFAGRDLIPSCT